MGAAKRNMRWHVVWHDIWDDICADNISEMESCTVDTPPMRLTGQLVPHRVRARPPGTDGNLRERTTLGKCHLAKAA